MYRWHWGGIEVFKCEETKIPCYKCQVMLVSILEAEVARQRDVLYVGQPTINNTSSQEVGKNELFYSYFTSYKCLVQGAGGIVPSHRS